MPSVSRDADAGTMLAAARWLAAQLDFAGGRVEPTAGHPVVRGEWLGAPGAPTILVYGHYDVQPTGDLAEWLTPPFELVQDGDVVRGRGSSDDKGPVYIVLKTARAFAAQEGGLPLNVKFLFEGEEEIGSPHLPGYLAEHAAELAADLVISADGAMWRPDEPSLSLASKGLAQPGHRGHRRPHRPALGPLRRHRGQPAARPGRGPGQPARPRRQRWPWPASTTAFPRSPTSAAREIAAVDFAETRFLAELGLDATVTASPGTAPWSGSGSGRRWRSTAWPAAASTP